jgi:LuxR family transcriptional regulator of csgAB operon
MGVPHMMSEDPFSGNPGSCLAFIVGPNHFQNAMLAAYIETHSHWRCTVADTVAVVLNRREEASPNQTVVIFDCFGLKDNVLERALQLELDHLPSGWELALFNLGSEAGIEKKALQYGVHGFFYQHDTGDTLLKGLAAISAGEFWAPRQKMAELILDYGSTLRPKQMEDQAVPNGLTRREVEILGLLTFGASNDVIANKLFISPNTVRTHLNHIFGKIKVKSRLAASAWATEKLFTQKHE